MNRPLFFLCILLSISALAQESSIDYVEQAYNEQNPYKSLELIADIQNVSVLSDSIRIKYHLAKGIAHGKLGNADSSIQYLNISISISEASGNEELLAKTYNSKGVLLRIAGKHEESLEAFQKALSIAESKSSKPFRVIQYEVLGNIGGIFYQLKKYKTALEYSELGLQQASAASDTSEMAYGNLRLAIVYQAMDSLDKSLLHNYTASKLLQKLNDFTTLIYVENTLGIIQKKQGRLDSSLFHQQKALQFSSKAGDNASIAHATLSVAETYLELDQLNQAKSIAMQGLKIAEQGNFPIHSRNAHDLLYRIAMKRGNYKKAVDERNAYLIVSDSLNNAEAQERLAEVETKYETEKKEAEITRLSLENELKEASLAQSEKIQLVILTGSSILLFMSIVVGRMYWQKSKIKEQLLVAEVNDLRGQIKIALEAGSSPTELDFNQVNKSLHTPLSDREFEILNYALTDISNTQIAEKTFISVNTVKYHLKNIYEKIGVGNKKEAKQFALSAKGTSE